MVFSNVAQCLEKQEREAAGAAGCQSVRTTKKLSAWPLCQLGKGAEARHPQCCHAERRRGGIPVCVCGGGDRAWALVPTTLSYTLSPRIVNTIPYPSDNS